MGFFFNFIFTIIGYLWRCKLVAPDGSLGDAAAIGKIIFKQGDGDVKIHHWFYGTAAAGLVMQSEILLANRV